ncbi:MAG: hypothetical protein VW338_15825 [Rhodospirillaceae bacterium]
MRTANAARFSAFFQASAAFCCVSISADRFACLPACMTASPHAFGVGGTWALAAVPAKPINGASASADRERDEYVHFIDITLFEFQKKEWGSLPRDLRNNVLVGLCMLPGCE